MLVLLSLFRSIEPIGGPISKAPLLYQSWTYYFTHSSGRINSNLIRYADLLEKSLIISQFYPN